MRKACVDKIFELGNRDSRVVYVGSDLNDDIAGRMKEELPGRGFMEGVSEQHLVGMCAGLALEGMIPYLHTIATFITRRCYEQVAMDLCLHNLPVRLVGNGGGLVYSRLGPTHLAVDDIAIMRAIPNMTIVCACDAHEMRRLMDQTLNWPGPIYIRVGSDELVISRPEHGFEIGRAIVMREGGRRPVVLVSTGVATNRALGAAEILAAEDIECSVVHMHTVKPLDAEVLWRYAINSRLIVTIEEHSVVGGLGSAVADALVNCLTPIRRLGVPDAFVEKYGSHNQLMAFYGLQPPQIAQSIRDAL